MSKKCNVTSTNVFKGEKINIAEFNRIWLELINLLEKSKKKV